jgi:hypothetical protein
MLGQWEAPGTRFAMIADAQSAGTAWVQGAQAGTTKWIDGIRNTPKDPTALAVAQQASMLANVTAAVTSGRWAAGLRKAGKSKWQSNSDAKQANYGAGVAQGEPAYIAAMSVWLPFMSTVQSSIATMPKGTLAASQARANAWSAALYNKKRTG